MSGQPWKRYAPSDSQPWSVRRVIHLHRRAAFGATWEEVQRDLRAGPEASIDRFLAGIQGPPDFANGGKAATPPIADATGDDFESLSERLAAAAVSSGSALRLKAWWFFRMMFAPAPLREKLTLMWHNHFATSNQKVRHLAHMKAQNDAMRRDAAANYAELLVSVVKSPATLIWLDAQANDQQHPNENLARELLELFSLGVGNYSEHDVRESARALTGWTIRNNQYAFDETLHDRGEKTILGQTGLWNGDDLLRIVAEHPATARRLAFRLCQLFLGDGVASVEAIEELAQGLRAHRMNISWGVETVLRSAAFFDDNVIGYRPLPPVDFIVGAVRGLEQFSPPPSTLLLAEWSAAMGQDLFYPPNVFGWPGGRSWLTSRTIIARANFAHAIVRGTAGGDEPQLEPGRFAEKYSLTSLAELRPILSALCCNASTEDESLGAGGHLDPPAVLRDFADSLLASPPAQLG